MFAPRAFAIRDEVPSLNELHGKSEGVLIWLKVRSRLSTHFADRAEQNCDRDRTRAHTVCYARFHGIGRKGLPPTQKWQTVFAPAGRSTAW